MRKQHSRETLNLLYGLQAMRQLPEEAGAIARAFGIADTLADIKRRRESEPVSFVYLIGVATDLDRCYKIGKSVQPHIRLKELQTGRAANMPPSWEGQRLRPLALRLGGLSVESAVHTSLQQYRLPRTEWFFAHYEVRKHIAESGGWAVWHGNKPDEASFTDPTVASQLGSPTIESLVLGEAAVQMPAGRAAKSP